MDQQHFSNQRMMQQSSQRMPHHSPIYNFYPQQQTFTAGHMGTEMGRMRSEMGYNQYNHLPRPNLYMHPGSYPYPRPALYPQDMQQAAIQREMEKQRIREEIMQDMARKREIGSYPYPRPALYPQDGQEAAIQREMEKQRIREEIMHDMARKREIEEEVRRELKMEAKLAIRTGIPFGLSPAVTGASGLAITGSLKEDRIALSVEEKIRCEDKGLEETMPFQRGKIVNLRISEVEPVLERGEEKKEIILLAQPDTNTSGSKRKAETPPAVDDINEPPALILKKKAKNEWTCALCQISATSKLGLNKHLLGKKHKSKEAASRTNRSRKNYVIGLLENITTESTQVASKPLKKDPEVTAEVQKNGGQGAKKYKHWCKICQVGTHSKKVMQNHKDGKNHLKRMSKTLLKVETVTDEAEEVDGRREHVISEKVEEMGAVSENHGAEDHHEPDCGAKPDHGSSSGKTEDETEVASGSS